MTKQHGRSGERAPAARRGTGRGPGAAPGQAAHPLMAIQRQVGNAQVQRMIAEIRRESAEDELQMRRDPLVQREGMPEEEEPIQAQRDPLVQRASEGGGVEVGAAGGPISDELSGRIQSMRGGGAPLADTTRGQMEQAFGSSFADVRLHTGSEAANVSERIGALAFTTGNDIFFGGSSSPADQSLLAHELTHVVQQGGAAPTSGPLTVGAANDSHEQQAETVAADVTGR